jgi:hypothetical protein
MAGFQVVEAPLRRIWVPINYNAVTLYVGQLVTMSGSGVIAYAQSGSTAKPFGVVVGNDNKEPVFNSTYKAESIASVQSQTDQLARKWAGLGDGGGMFVPGDPAAMVLIDVIGPNTVMEGKVFATSYGTVITEAVASSVSTTGASVTCATTGFDNTTTTNNAIIYCRTGLNSGLYRIVTTGAAGTSAQAVTLYWPYDIAIGDKFVDAPVSLGNCKIVMDSVGTFIDGAAAISSNYSAAEVLEVDLRNKGNERVIFRFTDVLATT